MSSFEKHNVAEILWEGPGEDVEVLSFHTTQSLSELYVIQAELKSPQRGLGFGDMLNAEVNLILKTGEYLDVDRYFSGIITQFHQQRSRHGNLPNASQEIFNYEVEIRPKLWLTTRRSNTKVFQEMTARDIIEEVLGEHQITMDWDLQGSPRTREYCVQYRETDFQFMSRLLEDEGITYFFNQQEKKVIFTDHPGGFPDCAPRAQIPYVEDSGGFFGYGAFELITDFQYREEIGSGKFSVNHYNYNTSQVKIDADKTQSQLPVLDQLEQYDPSWPYEDAGQGQTYVDIRMQEELSRVRSATGTTTARSFETGNVMEMQDHFRDDLNIKWLLTGMRITAEQGSYRCHFEAYPAEEPFRPVRKTPLPRVQGIQTAIVTGPDGAKVYLDSMGRCKLQFHWDRLGEMNDRSSMWVRVSNGYAGKDYGIQWIPRIGHEVLVDFINGDPDLPVVVGRVYNDFNTAPYGPVDKWKNIIKDIKDNHIVFDAEDGKEEVNVRAQKDMTTTVINNNSRSVGANESVSVGNDRSVSVGNNEDRSISVDQTITVGSNRSTTIGSNESITIGSDRNMNVGSNATDIIGSNKALTVGASDSTNIGSSQTLNVASARSVTVGTSETKTVGSNQSTMAGGSLSITAGGAMTLSSGAKVSLNASGALTITAPSVTIKAGKIKLSAGSGSVSVNPSGVKISGPTVTLSGIIKHNC